ncbi:cardiolipin synthase [Maritimibacter sp. DP1N21-5]|uniref:cardiolipin synthase n=1 Tax=Maritimibacter sp. DP1N21-5 TaxID=2836867 RepID=UPI0021054A3B|nr:cardiolipin synthase [Maritimibacter sp. DP1N21-5]
MFWIVAGYLIHAATILRVLQRPHRDPAARAAWVLTVLALPFVGVVAYVMFGEIRLGRRRSERLRRVRRNLARNLPRIEASDPKMATPYPAMSPGHAALFRVGQSISGFAPSFGNSATLLPDSIASIDAMIEDIDAARDHVHVEFYIWVADESGTRLAEALIRAAERGVTVRAIADDLGSRRLIRAPIWQRMAESGVGLARASQVGNPLLRVIVGRIDLRNHRKIVVIDGTITYCGSQNAAHPSFVQKRRYAPWIDVIMRFTGPVAWQNQAVFLADWLENKDESDEIGHLLEDHRPTQGNGLTAPEGVAAQVIATGPGLRPSAMPELFTSLIYSAQNELFITTPYYVPSEAIQSALVAAANRGVAVKMIFPARNDSRLVGSASRSYYYDLIMAGVRIFEYGPGLLHSKTVIVDGTYGLIGSANMDRRSFDLNFENNILFVGAEPATALRRRQEDYLADCVEVTSETIAGWHPVRRLWQNAVAIAGPVL